MVVRESVKLHPETVKNHAQFVSKKQRGVGKRAPLKVVKIDARIWEAAMQLAKGDSTRIRVVSPFEVIVTNNSRKKAR